MKALIRGKIVLRFEATGGNPHEPLARVILEIPRQSFSKEDEEKLRKHPEIASVEFRRDIRDLINRDNDFYTIDIRIKSLSISVRDMMRKAADTIAGAIYVEKIE